MLYELSGSNKDQFRISSESITIVAVKKVALIKYPSLALLKTPSSTSANILLQFQCPEIGRAYTYLSPKGAISPKPLSHATISSLYNQYIQEQQTLEHLLLVQENKYEKWESAQWKMIAIEAQDRPHVVSFQSASGLNYTAGLFCVCWPKSSRST